jgi:hypothetical protein
MFTLKKIFRQGRMSDEVSRKKRFKIGRSVASSYKAVYGKDPNRIMEDGFMVNLYPDVFKDRALKLIKRSLMRANRKRIVANSEAVGERSRPKRARLPKKAKFSKIERK